MNHFITHLKWLAERVVQAPFGSGEFYVLLGVAAFVMLVAGSFINGAIIGKTKGSLVVFLAQVLILLVAFVMAALVQAYAGEAIGNAHTLNLLSVALAILGGWFMFSLLRKPMMNAGWVTGLMACLFVFALGYAGLWVGDEVFTLLETGSDKVNELKQEFTNED